MKSIQGPFNQDEPNPLAGLISSMQEIDQIDNTLRSFAQDLPRDLDAQRYHSERTIDNTARGPAVTLTLFSPDPKAFQAYIEAKKDGDTAGIKTYRAQTDKLVVRAKLHTDNPLYDIQSQTKNGRTAGTYNNSLPKVWKEIDGFVKATAGDLANSMIQLTDLPDRLAETLPRTVKSPDAGKRPS